MAVRSTSSSNPAADRHRGSPFNPHHVAGRDPTVDPKRAPVFAYKAIDSRRTLIGFTSPAEAEKVFRGHVLDLRTLSSRSPTDR